ncbi:MAG TPA: P-loop NTPase [Acholeplasmataceae bacterium]|nr:P-loop NTPase [Acholeplasmataceae bacterium]
MEKALILEKIGEIIDPTEDKTLKELNSIKNINITKNNIVEVTIELDDLLNKDVIKLAIAKIIKIDLAYPGLKINFTGKEKIVEPSKIKYLAIASGKGGVGKSTVTANLAIALRNLGVKVGIIDADIYGASIPFVLNMEIKPLDLNDEGLIIPAKYQDIEIISTEFFMPKDKPLMWRGPLVTQMINMYFSGVIWQNNPDIILIDLPPGTGDIAMDVRERTPKSDMIIVTNPNVAAANIAVKAGLGSKEIGHNIFGVIENMSYYLNLCSKERDYIFGTGGGSLVAEKLKVDLLAQIPIGIPNDNDTIYDQNTIQAKIYLMIAKKYLEKYGD